VGAGLAMLALGLKSELVGPGQVWSLAGALLLLAVPAVYAYLFTETRTPAVEHFIPAAVGAVAVAGLAVLIPEWWKYGLVALTFGLVFVASGRLDYLRLRDAEKPGHLMLQEGTLALIVAAAYLVILSSTLGLALKLLWVFVISVLAAYRSFRVLGKPLAPQRAFLFSLLVGQVVTALAWALSVYVLIQTQGVFAVMLLLAWYINRGMIRHTVEETLSRQVVLEYGAFSFVLAYLFITSFQVPR
jgi:hypothetical protein